MTEGRGGGNGEGLGAVRGEIPLFGPGAGSAASAGMTDLRGLEGGLHYLVDAVDGQEGVDLFGG